MKKEKISTLYNTVDRLIQLKNDLPIIIIMVTQLNRTVEDPLRRVNGNIGNYPNSGDIFGGDALYQGSDIVMALSRPFTFDITSYGPKNYVVTEDSIFMHLLKVRNGANKVNMLFMKGLFDKQKMIEAVEPGMNIVPENRFIPRSQQSRRPPSADIGSEL